MADALVGKVKGVADVNLKTLINTHWHSDHTGGNVALAKAGAGIVAHVNTLKRLSSIQHMEFFNRDVEPSRRRDCRRRRLARKEKISLAAKTVHVTYLPPAHTDGDSTVHFTKAYILSTGDLMFSGMYPFIDYSSGGSIEGMISNAGAL